jgi:hypothetical protein
VTKFFEQLFSFEEAAHGIVVVRLADMKKSMGPKSLGQAFVVSNGPRFCNRRRAQLARSQGIRHPDFPGRIVELVDMCKCRFVQVYYTM